MSSFSPPKKMFSPSIIELNYLGLRLNILKKKWKNWMKDRKRQLTETGFVSLHFFCIFK